MRFDYYAATVPASVSHCHQAIISDFGGFLAAEKPVKPYEVGVRHPETNIRVYHGGHNPLPFVVSSGPESADAAGWLRRRFPGHRVSRADVCYDFRREGGFDEVGGVLDPIARAAGVSVTFMGDPAPGQTGGRTYYFGSTTSDVRLVLYEKGLHQRAKGDEAAPADWCRLELRVRPRKDRKTLAAAVSEAELWGFARWTGKVAEQVLGMVPEYHPDLSKRMNSTEQAFAHMLRQYATTMQGIERMHGRQYVLDHITDALDGDREG